MEDYNIEKHVYDTELSKYKKAWDEFQKHADIVVMGVTELTNEEWGIWWGLHFTMLMGLFLEHEHKHWFTVKQTENFQMQLRNI